MNFKQELIKYCEKCIHKGECHKFCAAIILDLYRKWYDKEAFYYYDNGELIVEVENERRKTD